MDIIKQENGPLFGYQQPRLFRMHAPDRIYTS